MVVARSRGPRCQRVTVAAVPDPHVGRVALRLKAAHAGRDVLPGLRLGQAGPAGGMAERDPAAVVEIEVERHLVRPRSGARAGEQDSLVDEAVRDDIELVVVDAPVAVEVFAQGVRDQRARTGLHEHRAEGDVLVRVDDPQERVGAVGAIDLQISVEIPDLAHVTLRVVGRIVEGLVVRVQRVPEGEGLPRQLDVPRRGLQGHGQVDEPVVHGDGRQRRRVDAQREGRRGDLATGDPPNVLRRVQQADGGGPRAPHAEGRAHVREILVAVGVSEGHRVGQVLARIQILVVIAAAADEVLLRPILVLDLEPPGHQVRRAGDARRSHRLAR